MLGITPRGEVPLLRQWRAPLQKWVWELPAGLCDVQGESPVDAARRELEEETGWRAGELQLLFTGTVSPGLTDELFSAFLCLDMQHVSDGGGTGGERIEVHLVPLAQLAPFLMAEYAAGGLVDSKIFAHLALAEARLADDDRQA
jgi:ADP-ribose pyrophosphatase